MCFEMQYPVSLVSGIYSFAARPVRLRTLEKSDHEMRVLAARDAGVRLVPGGRGKLLGWRLFPEMIQTLSVFLSILMSADAITKQS